jgi:hypothetical protein
VILSRPSAVPPRHRGAAPPRALGRALAALAAAALVPVAAGCEAGNNAATQRWHQPTPGATAQASNGIRVSNMFVLGAPPGSALPAGGSAGLFFALAGSGSADRLIGISAPGAAASVRLPSGGVPVGGQQSVLLTGPEPRVVLENLTRSLGGGQTVRLVLDFQNAGVLPISVPIMPRAQYFATFSPAPASPPPSPAATGRHRHRKAGATPTPSPTSS